MAPLRTAFLTLLLLAPVAHATESDDHALIVDIEHGQPSPVVDSVGWVLGIPSKLLLWDRRADNHAVSEETIDDTAEYLATNRVDGVMVRVNQYDPIGEWRRLSENDRIGLGWRATFGSIYTLSYTVVPGRLFGRDWYNPYTDSVHVFSDIPALAMEQAAQAKDVHDRTHPGFYSAVQALPLVGLMHEARSKQAVFEHVDKTGTTEERAEARRVLQPQLGSEVGGHVGTFVPQGDAVLKLTGAAIGHAVGRYQASKILEADQPTAEIAEAQEEPSVEAIPTASGPVSKGPVLIPPRD